jgi:transposase
MRARFVAFVEEGNSHPEAARHLHVSPRFVNNMVILTWASGALQPVRQDIWLAAS